MRTGIAWLVMLSAATCQAQTGCQDTDRWDGLGVVRCVSVEEEPASAESIRPRAPFWTAERKSRALDLGIVTAVTAYGVSRWEWGESSFAFRSEGWFGSDTGSGGADKLGHAFTGVAATAIGTALHRRWGFDEQTAIRRGAFIGLLLTTAVEIGDGFSPDHGFSWEDQVVNMAGVGFEYLRQRHPRLRERMQFRWEYLPSEAVTRGGHRDILTDYSGSRWMLAFPLHAWGANQGGWRWFELQLGYGTRGFAERDREYFDRPRRYPFVGIGIHMPLLARRAGLSTGTARTLEYLQIPGTAWPLPP